MINLSPAQISFIKALGVVALVSVLSFLGDASHFTGVLNPILAAVIAALAASFEAKLRSNSGDTTALFGAVNVR